jgi:hypothetical protein
MIEMQIEGLDAEDQRLLEAASLIGVISRHGRPRRRWPAIWRTLRNNTSS